MTRSKESVCSLIPNQEEVQLHEYHLICHSIQCKSERSVSTYSRCFCEHEAALINWEAAADCGLRDDALRDKFMDEHLKIKGDERDPTYHQGKPKR